jgi:hypothetical protein
MVFCFLPGVPRKLGSPPGRSRRSSLASAARMMSVLKALFGQLYLVTIVAVIVSNVGAGRVRRADVGDTPAKPN